MSFWVRAVLVLLLSGTLHATAHINDFRHPDIPGLLALKATICDNCTELSTWESGGDPCRTFDGVYCAWVLGTWRVVGVQLQLPAANVSFDDNPMSPGGTLAVLSYLRELEVLCVKQTPPPGPPKPQPTPSNTPARQQRQRQWGAQSQQLVHFRQQLWQGSAAAAAEPQGLHVSRWLATADADVLLDSHSLASSTGGTRPPSQDAGEAQQQQQQQQVPPIGTDPARSGELPYSWFAAYPHLVHLRVVGCGAAGALQGGRIAGAKRLASLVLSHNKLQGTLPDEFVGLQHLSVLDLSNNHLSGPLPVSWTAMQHLHYLYLNNNNLTGVLPCEWASLQLLLADLSGNQWHPSARDGDLGSWGPSHLLQSHIASSTHMTSLSQKMTSSDGVSRPDRGAAVTTQQHTGGTGSWSGHQHRQPPPPHQHRQPPPQQQQQRRHHGHVSSSSPSGSSDGSDAGSSGSREGLVMQQLQRAFGGVLAAPRCWLREYCYVEGAFICLQRSTKKAATGGCSSYVYGASDLHVDSANQCDHGGSNLVAVAGMFVVFAATLLLIWLHHCRAVKWMHQPGNLYAGQQQQQRQQPQQQQGPWQQRQWLISGPNTPRRARARSIGGGTGAAAVYSSSNSSGLKEPLLPQAPPTLPLLYHPATSEHEGAGYSSPVSSSSAADFRDAAATAAGTPDGLLPSALTTPSAGAISIRPQGGAGRGGKGRGLGARRGSSKGLAAAAAGGRGSGGSSGALQESSGYESDASSTAGAGAGDGTTAHLSAHWLNPGYYFHGNEPLPPWAGGVARMLAATLGPPDRSGGGSDGSSGCFDPALLLPLVFFLLGAVTNLWLLLLWGLGPPAHVKLWPSYALLGLMCVPHFLVGAVVHFRLLAVACLPEALKAAAVSQDEILSEAILPPGSGVLVMVYSWLFAAPAWVAYPLILLLLLPGVVLLTLLCPLLLLMGCCGLGSFKGVVRYIQLLQGCAALTQSAGSAGLLTVLFFMGNVPLEWAFLDSSLYYLTVAADLANISVAWWLRLQAVKQQQLLALAALPDARGQEWS